MNLRKIAVLGLSAVALLSCSKSLSITDAKKFVKDNYSNKTVKNLKSVEIKVDCTASKGTLGKAAAEIALSLLSETSGIEYKADSLLLSGNVTKGILFEECKRSSEFIITEDYIIEKEGSLTFTYSSKGSELTSKATYEDGYYTNIYNSNGQRCKSESYTKNKIDDNNTAIQSSVYIYNFEA